MNGERNAGDKRQLSAGEWECWGSHCSPVLSQIMQVVNVNTQEARREDWCEKSHLRQTDPGLMYQLSNSYFSRKICFLCIAHSSKLTYPAKTYSCHLIPSPPPSVCPPPPSTGCIGSQGQDWKPQKTLCTSVAWFLF